MEAKNMIKDDVLEYLMVYGWAILIIVVVVVALYAMNVFNKYSEISCEQLANQTCIEKFMILRNSFSKTFECLDNKTLEIHTYLYSGNCK
jgi:purine-cytosine permease-like protein